MHVAEVIPHGFHALAHGIAVHTGPLSGAVEWVLGAIEAALVGLVVGGAIVVVVRRLTRHPEQLIVD